MTEFKYFSFPSVYMAKIIGNKYKCWYCGRSGTMTADHFYPKSRGGRLKVMACTQCNKEKSGMTPLEWISYIDNMIKICSLKNGCFRGKYIKSICPENCIEFERLNRIKFKTKGLWEIVKNSVQHKNGIFNYETERV